MIPNFMALFMLLNLHFSVCIRRQPATNKKKNTSKINSQVTEKLKNGSVT